MSEVEYNGLKFKYRLNTTDYGIIKEACGGLNTRWFDVKAEEIWLDVGAHIGAFSIYAASKGATIVAYEPMPENYALLEENIELNNFSKKIHAIKAGITKNGGIIDLYIDTVNYGNCSKFSHNNLPSIKIYTFPAIDFNIIKKPYCMKIDTEGCEYEILSSINLENVKKVIFEYHYWLVENPAEEWKKLSKLLLENFNEIKEEGGYMHYAWK